MPCCMFIHNHCNRRIKYVAAVTDCSLQDCVDCYQTLLEIHLAFTSQKISWQLSLLYCIIWLFKFKLKVLTVKSRLHCISYNDSYKCSKSLFQHKNITFFRLPSASIIFLFDRKWVILSPSCNLCSLFAQLSVKGPNILPSFEVCFVKVHFSDSGTDSPRGSKEAYL